jgi:hypothetical protein
VKKIARSKELPSAPIPHLEGRCPAMHRKGKHEEYLNGSAEGWFTICRACGLKKEWKKYASQKAKAT